MYYKPILSDGETAPLPWQIRTFFLNITWPLKDKPNIWMIILNYLQICMALTLFLYVAEGEVLFIIQNLSDINVAVEALVTFIVCNESTLRVFNMAFTKSAFKQFLKEFYKNIYIKQDDNLLMWKEIRKGLIPATLYTYGYMSVLTSFLLAPIINFRNDEKSLPNKMVLHYGYEDPYVYWLTLLYLYWIAAIIIFFYIGEAFLLATCILHLNARYKILQREMQTSTLTLVAEVPSSRLTYEFRKKIVRIFIKNNELNNFAKLLNKTYDYRIFVLISFSAALLCVLCFQVASSGPLLEGVRYWSWMIAKISELLIFGSLGSTLLETTNEMSTSYYLSNWEESIYRSKNWKENLLLMRDIQIIISVNKKPFRLTGFNYFDITLGTVLAVLKMAFSFFTCLRTIKEG